MTRFGRLSDRPVSFVVNGARVVDPASGTDGPLDVAVRDGRLTDPAQLPPGTPTLDGHGLVVTPGLCDLHTHLREPGDEGAETIQTGSRAAAHGGFTTICAMPNTRPPLDEPARVAWVAARAVDASCRVRIVGSATRGREGEALADLAALREAGVVAVSDDGAAIPSARLARAALAELRELGIPLLEHAEEPTLGAGAVVRSGAVATRLGLPGWPASAELVVVERDIALAAETGARLHLTHLSTAAAVAAVRRAKDAGVAVTCDVTPHHLALTDAWVGGVRTFAWQQGEADELGAGATMPAANAYDASCRVTPPLAHRDEALALLAAVAEGTVDAIATDHAPHPPQRKEVPFAEAAPGMIGLQTALSLGLAAVEAGCVTLPRLIAALSTRPAAIIGEERSLAIGQPADLVVVDPGARWRTNASALESRSANSPLLGMELPGVVRLTVADGRVTWNDGLLPA